MKYKFEFMQADYVPQEYLEMDLARRKRDGIDEIVKMISKDYNWETRRSEGGNEIHKIELVVCSAEKFNHGMNRLSAAMCLFPELKHIAQSIIEEMFNPDEEV